MLEMQFRNSGAKAVLSKIQMPAFCRLWPLPEIPFPILASTMIRIGNLHEIQGRGNNNKRMCLLLFKKLKIPKLKVIGFGVQGRTVIFNVLCQLEIRRWMGKQAAGNFESEAVIVHH